MHSSRASRSNQCIWLPCHMAGQKLSECFVNAWPTHCSKYPMHTGLAWQIEPKFHRELKHKLEVLSNHSTWEKHTGPNPATRACIWFRASCALRRASISARTNFSIAVGSCVASVPNTRIKLFTLCEKHFQTFPSMKSVCRGNMGTMQATPI